MNSADWSELYCPLEFAMAAVRHLRKEREREREDLKPTLFELALLAQSGRGVANATAGHISEISQTDEGAVRHDKLSRSHSVHGDNGYGHASHDMADERCMDYVDFNSFCYLSAQSTNWADRG